MTGVGLAVRRLRVRHLGVTPYQPVFEAMQAFTAARTAATDDELWLTQHEPVFTQGQAGKAEHVLAASEIPIVQSDRGGQVTYHGPGQIVGYLLFDLRRLGATVRDLVAGIESSITATLALDGISSAPRRDAPGVYVDDRKIGSLGLRVRKGCSYHGLSLNVAMDLAPFAMINPCGMAGLEVTQVRDLGGSDLTRVEARLVEALAATFQFSELTHTSDSWDLCAT